MKYTAEGFRADESRQYEPTRTSQKGLRVTGLRALRKGDARVGDVVYSKLVDGSYVKRKVRSIEDRGFYNVLHTVKVSKIGKLGKSESTSAEGDFYA